jgi:hypothetical protein
LFGIAADLLIFHPNTFMCLRAHDTPVYIYISSNLRRVKKELSENYGTVYMYMRQTNRIKTDMMQTPPPKKKLNSMVWVRERTIPTERPPLAGEVIANFCGSAGNLTRASGSISQELWPLDHRDGRKPPQHKNKCP